MTYIQYPVLTGREVREDGDTMKKARLMIFCGIVCLFTFTAQSFGADAGRIGIIDFQRILMESEAGRAVQARIQEEGRSMESDLRKMGEEIESMMQQLQRDSMVMSAERREQQQQELEMRRYDFQSMQRKYQSEFREMEIRMVEKLQNEVFGIAEAIGKQEGYLLIIERSAAVYYPSTIDVTDRVIQAYNEQFDGSL